MVKFDVETTFDSICFCCDSTTFDFEGVFEGLSFAFVDLEETFERFASINKQLDEIIIKDSIINSKSIYIKFFAYFCSFLSFI